MDATGAHTRRRAPLDVEQGLGATFAPEVDEAWALAYGTLAGIMKGAQRSEMQAAA